MRALLIQVFLCFLFSKSFSQCSVNISVIQYPSCQFNNDGILTTSVQGVPPFTYLWSNGETTSTIDSLQSDYYTVTVTDSLNCNIQHSIFLSSGNLQFTYSIIPPSCSVCDDGSMSLVVNNGIPPYSYLWSTSETTPSIQINGIDSYSCCITDSVGCYSCGGSGISGIDSVFGPRICGKIYFDYDDNGFYTPGDFPLSHWPVVILPDSIIGFSDFAGNYCLYLDSGIYTLRVLTFNPSLNATYNLSSDSLEYHLIVNSVSQDGFDFGLSCNTCEHDIDIQMVPQLDHCRSDSIKKISLRNMSPYPENVTIQFITPNSIYHSSWPFPAIVSGDTVRWSIPHLPPLGFAEINVQLSLPPVGSTATYSIIATSIDSSENLVDSDTDLVVHTITCSFDPNDKTVLPEGVDSAHYTLYDSMLRYLIRFQNTGTDTAFNVIITDTLDPSLDLNTFTFISSSHPVRVELNPQTGIIQFTFVNILLPDSNIDAAGSNGYVYYSISPLQGLVLPVEVNNSAYIFFDSNDPVQTNITLNTLVNTLSSVSNFSNNELSISIFPIPTSDILQIKINNIQIEIAELEVRNILGETIFLSAVNSYSYILNCNHFNPGIYFLELKLSDGRLPVICRFLVN